MNIKKITNKLILWKNINNFYSFDQLLYLSNQYYHGVRILLAASDCIFDFNFFGTKIINPLTNKNEIILEITYNGILFSNDKDINKINNKYNPWFSECCYTFNEQKFKIHFKNDIINKISQDHKIIKFCLMSELYQNILDGVII